MYQLLYDALPYLLAFYLFEGLLRIEAGQVVLLRAWRRWRARGGGLVLAGLWPTGEAARGYEPPLLITEAGVHVPRAGASFPIPRREDLDFHAFEPGGAFDRDGRKVRGGGRTVLTAPSEAAAEHALSLLRSVSESPAGERRAALRRGLARAGDLGRLRGHHERYAASARRLRALAAALFAALFGVVPLLLAGGTSTTRPLVATLVFILVIHVALVAMSRQALRRTENVGSGALLSLALFPPSAMHAPLVVTRDLFASFHPLAVAAALLPAAAFEPLARRERHRLEVAIEAAHGTDLEDAWRARLEALDALVVAAEADVSRVKAAPPRLDESAAGYCPLCFTEYREGFSACSDCGTSLRAFTTAAPRGGAAAGSGAPARS